MVKLGLAYHSTRESGKHSLLGGCVCIICMYAFVWVHVYFSLNPINQVSSTSAITYLARLLFLVPHFYSGLGIFTPFLLILWSALFPGYFFKHIRNVPRSYVSGSQVWISAIFGLWYYPRYSRLLFVSLRESRHSSCTSKKIRTRKVI